MSANDSGFRNHRVEAEGTKHNPLEKLLFDTVRDLFETGLRLLLGEAYRIFLHRDDECDDNKDHGEDNGA